MPEKTRNILTEAVTSGDRRSIFHRYGDRPSYSGKEKFIRWLLASMGHLTVMVTVSIILVLLVDALFFFEKASFIEFFTGTKWEPFGQPKKLGVLPLFSGTMMIAFGSCMVAIPFGFGSAVYLTQYASPRFQALVKPVIEVLGGVPTVVYGYFALTGITPLLKVVFPEIQVFNALSASIVVGISIIPMVSSLSSDAMNAVPNSIKTAGYAVGMQKFHVVTKIIIPASTSGVIASFMLAFARAVGETMTVTLAAGSTPNMSWNYLEGIQTMTAFIVQMSLGDTPAGSIEYYTIYAIGLSLFGVTFLFNFIATTIVKRFREVYK
ncbi:MAG: phosphate ABC transporter permease subunit PstC [Spirochaetia bacterium]|nr:phosphate ABC transporter permease subunit PstC [Spirochaetia bacterium]